MGVMEGEGWVAWLLLKRMYSMSFSRNKMDWIGVVGSLVRFSVGLGGGF